MDVWSICRVRKCDGWLWEERERVGFKWEMEGELTVVRLLGYEILATTGGPKQRVK
ncbi:hypothetical protein Hanom_Chr13g01221791 [Helianthus anomalus]